MNDEDCQQNITNLFYLLEGREIQKTVGVLANISVFVLLGLLFHYISVCKEKRKHEKK